MRKNAAAFETAYAMGVKIAFGTDCGIYPHGENADELIEMVRLGMTPADALRSATVVAAELFGIDGITGRIEPEAIADLIAVAGDPTRDIQVVKDVPYVIKSGRIVKRDGVPELALDYSLEHNY
jgi:imidazolonepropionase-like amidohydrolase